ncbi:MAG: response regulator transcription factor [Chloroflexota bacterium]|nr:MAG: response regulator transcription factor [Chloroflexota bacterium]
MIGVGKVLLVDDEPTLVATLDYNLRRDGHEVVIARDGLAAVEQARATKPDVILLDVMLPKLDGFEACRAIRRFSDAAILLLTARDAEIDKVVGLEIGADDYITKPFSMREVLARVKAHIRRGARVAPPGPVNEDAIVVGSISIDLPVRVVTRNGARIQMKPRVFDLLAFLIRNRGQVVTRDQLLDRVWGYAYDGGTRTVDVHVRWLRESLEDDPASPRLIQTVRGVGYRLAG